MGASYVAVVKSVVVGIVPPWVVVVPPPSVVRGIEPTVVGLVVGRSPEWVVVTVGIVVANAMRGAIPWVEKYTHG